MLDIDQRSDQIAVEKLALQLTQLPEIQPAAEEVRNMYRARPGMDSKDGVDTLEDIVRENIWMSCISVANMDRAHPKIIWINNPPRDSHGVKVPGGRQGFDNPDRVYRFMHVNPEYRYEVYGYYDKNAGPFTQLLESCEDKPPLWGYPLKIMYSHDIELNDDGSFVITLDSEPANGRKNHLQMPPGTGHINFRDSIVDWNRDLPVQLAVKRVGGPEVAPWSFDDYAKRVPGALRMAPVVALEWYDSKNDITAGPGPLPKNTIEGVRIRPSAPGQKAWGMTSPGKYSIKDDEALVFTVDLQGANYFSVQVTNPWMISIDYTKHTSSLNNFQSELSDNGTATYVIAMTDPGVYNWLDASGMNDGVLLARWEQMTSDPDPTTAVKNVQRVKLSELDSVLPTNTKRVTPEQRREQLALRQAGYARRVAKILGPEQG